MNPTDPPTFQLLNEIAIIEQLAAIGGVLSEAEIAEMLPALRRLRAHLDAARD